MILYSVEGNMRLTMQFISCARHFRTSTLLHPSVTGRVRLGVLPLPQLVWCKDKGICVFGQQIWTLMGER